VHSIGAGILAVCISRSSDIVYNIYNFPHSATPNVGLPLHLQIEKALDVMDFGQADEYLPAAEVNGNTVLATNSYFTTSVRKIDGYGSIELDGTTFHNLVVLEGEGNISDADEILDIKKGDSFFIPACDLIYTLYGEVTVLITSMN
jgi:mannose-6-phosphate isomerase